MFGQLEAAQGLFARAQTLVVGGAVDAWAVAEVLFSQGQLLRAEKLQKRAARTGFDWPDASGARAKIDEELAELEAETDHHRKLEEMGDLLFAVVNLARHVGVDSEAALRGCNAKFGRRFNHIERALRARGRGPKEATLEEMEALWIEAKERARSR